MLYCTGTFALGINMPARAACFDAMVRFDGRRLIPLPAREFMQMAGRAGRRGLDDFGQVVVRTDLEDWPEIAPQLRAYLDGANRASAESLLTSFNSVVNLMHRHTPEHVREVVEKSFLAYYRRKTAARHTDNASRLHDAIESEDGATNSKEEATSASAAARGTCQRDHG